MVVADSILFAFHPLFVAYNHGVALLSAICKSRGIRTGLHLLTDIARFSNFVNDCDYDAIGFSAVTIHDFKAIYPYMVEAIK